MVAMLSLSSDWPYMPDMPMQPRDKGNTCGPALPSWRNLLRVSAGMRNWLLDESQPNALPELDSRTGYGDSRGAHDSRRVYGMGISLNPKSRIVRTGRGHTAAD